MSDKANYEQVFSILQAAHPDLAEWFYKKFKKQFVEEKGYQLWPLNMKWWRDKKFDGVREQYKFLEDILIEIVHKRIRHTRKETRDLISAYNEKDIEGNIYNKHWITINEKYYYPALLKQGSKAWIARRVNCSTGSIENYLAALVRIEALEIFRLGKNGTYYSAGYWTEGPIKDSSWVPFVRPYLTMELAKRLLDSDQFYLRKKNKTLAQ